MKDLNLELPPTSHTKIYRFESANLYLESFETWSWPQAVVLGRYSLFAEPSLKNPEI